MSIGAQEMPGVKPILCHDILQTVMLSQQKVKPDSSFWCFSMSSHMVFVNNCAVYVHICGALRELCMSSASRACDLNC